MGRIIHHGIRGVVDPKEIGPDESAVIFAADGKPRLFFPDGPDDEPINEGARWMTRVAMMIAKPEIQKQVDELIDEAQRQQGN